MPDIKANIGEIGWNRLLTLDMNKAKAFYSSLFNWESHDVTIEDTKISIFTLNNKIVAGLFLIPEGVENIRPHWMSYVTVDNLDKTIEKSTELGASQYGPIRVIPKVGRIAILFDPSGAYIGIIEP